MGWTHEDIMKMTINFLRMLKLLELCKRKSLIQLLLCLKIHPNKCYKTCRQNNKQAIPLCPEWKCHSLAFNNKNELENSCVNALGPVTGNYKWLRHHL